MKRPTLALMATLLLLLTTLTAAADTPFITDTAYRARVEKAYQGRTQLVGKQFFGFPRTLTAEERGAMHFMYAYMPLADITDYSTQFWLQNVRGALRARSEMAWGKKVPELLFRHFVLPVRINNEALDDSRDVFWAQLKDRIKGMTMHDAILEVNHWCHEHVTYQPSDGRTSAPLATLRTATGRCGEQSTFAVAALRAVGIPARQVYTPRWAHTDDNHAWVEAWADGTWYFLGACEPEPVLNLGWFNAPASRAMLMHTQVFGDYNGPEEVMARTATTTEINLIGNYAATATSIIKVVDAAGRPVSDATVEFKIYNYGEFYTAARKQTGADGTVSLTSGRGTLLVWASKGGRFGYKNVAWGTDNLATVVLDRTANDPAAAQLWQPQTVDVVPPAEHVRMPDVSDAQRAENNRRFAYEDSLRMAYTATFPTEEQAKAICPDAAKYIVKARGNAKTITDFLAKHKDNAARAIALLATLTDKDLRDIRPEILEDSYAAASDQLSPRVESEHLLAPFKQELARTFDAQTAQKMRQNPDLLVQWVKKNIRINPDPQARRITQTPTGVLRARLADTWSRDIFFVDMARSLGIEAQEDPVTGKVQYKKDGQWRDVRFAQAVQKTAPQGTLVLEYEPTALLANPKYYNHFSISRIDNGRLTLLNFEEGQTDMGDGTSWQNTFKDGVALDAGTYMLTSGTRMASGAVLAQNQVFKIEEGKTTRTPLVMRQNAEGVSVIGQFDSESQFQKDGKAVSVLSQTGRGYFVVGVIGVGQEPTNHALHDIEKCAADIEAWGRPLVLLFESEEAQAKFNPAEFAHLPKNTIWGIDKDGAIRRQIAREMKFEAEKLLPMFIVADTFNRVVFCKQGYTIGLGEQLKQVIHKLDEK